MRFSEEYLARIEKRAKEGDAESQYVLGDVYVNDSDGDERMQLEGFYLFEKAAAQGHALAQLSLAVCYEMGICPAGECDDEKAFFWYEKAAENGVTAAQYQLARDYEKGLTVQQNYEKAFFWYSKAAENGSIDAQYYLGYYYENGLGVQKDTKKAISHYRIAADSCLIGTNEMAKKRLKELEG